ncbi:hypothetical protein MFUL124B02_10080 [Myxococcus fulvus 124B02]|nr:hypothetical protein MFUL124B02_10080 [Myxococcus fulvus 124B02]
MSSMTRMEAMVRSPCPPDGGRRDDGHQGQLSREGQVPSCLDEVLEIALLGGILR